MVLGPEFGPLAAIAVGVVLHRGYLSSGAFRHWRRFPAGHGGNHDGAVFDALRLLSTAALDNLDQVDFIYKVEVGDASAGISPTFTG